MNDPDQLRVLLARTCDAAQQLRELRCHDPAATRAMQTLRLTEHTLEEFWLPALHRLVDDEHIDPGGQV